MSLAEIGREAAERQIAKERGPITVYGASDDLIEVEGAIEEEFSYSDDENGDLLAFSCGVVLRIRYTAGVWRITPVSGAEMVRITQAPEDDDDNYSDRAVISTLTSWVVHGTGFAKVRDLNKNNGS